MIFDGTLDRLKDDFISKQATESCYTNTISYTTNLSSVADDRDNRNSNNRRLFSQAYSNGYAHWWPDDALSLKTMAGTFLLHLILSVLSISIGVLSCLMKNRRIGKETKEEENQGRSLIQEVDLSKQDSTDTPPPYISSIQTQIDELQSVQNKILLTLENIEDKLNNQNTGKYVSIVGSVDS